MNPLTSLFRRGAALPVTLLIILSVVMAGCHSRKGAVTASPGYTPSGSTPSQVARASVKNMPDATRRLMAEADAWLGTPYRYGGTSRGKGADCSGFVTQVYANALSIKLPRNSAKQQQWCSPLGKNRKDFLPGDLVFFAPRGSRGVNHVGIYIGDGKMIHSSSSKGVIVSSLDEDYYKRTYHSAGRVEQYFVMIDRKDERDFEQLPPKSEVATPILAAENPKPRPKATAAISLDRLAAASEKKETPEKREATVIKAVTEQPDTSLTADEARRRLLLRLENDTIR